MAATAFSDATNFLRLHPWATTDADNPVEILRDLHVEHEALLQERNDLQDRIDDIEEEFPSRDALVHAGAQIDKLLAFVRGLHDEQKISDLEYKHATAIAKRVPAVCSRSEVGRAPGVP